MFKINIYLKLALIVVFLGGGILLAFFQSFWYALPLILIGLGLLASYFLLGTIMSAAEFLQMNDFEAAEKRLDMTVRPQWLYVTNRAMFYIMKGSIAAQRKDFTKAEGLFNQALALKLPSDNEKAMVLLQLANIHASRNNWQSAKSYYQQTKKLNITEVMLKNQVDQFEQVFQNRGQMNAARAMGRKGMQMMQGRGGSSKRRRPRAR